MPVTYSLIGSATVGSGGAFSIDFTNIPGVYTDLVLKLSGRSNRNDSTNIVDSFVTKVNGSSTGYTNRLLYVTGYNSGVTSATDTTSLYGVAGATITNSTANTFGNAEYYIPNYAGSTNKSASFDGVGENNATNAWMGMAANLWSNTSAITSIAITPIGGTAWLQYTTAYLYGIKNS